jgi:hypothetical protein
MWQFGNIGRGKRRNAASQQKTTCALHLRTPFYDLQTRFGALLSWTFPP